MALNNYLFDVMAIFVIVAVVIFGIYLLISYGVKKIQERTTVTSGTITAKEYVKAHDDHTILFIGKSFVPITRQVPDEWSITIQDDKGRTTEYLVAEDEYYYLRVGQLYSVE